MATAEYPELIPVLSELFLAIIGMALLIFGVFQKGGHNEQDLPTFRYAILLSVAALLLTTLITSMLAGERLLTFNDMFISDGFSVFCKILVLLASAGSLIVAKGFLERHELARFEFPVLVIFATLGMLMMISANDMIALYLGLEMQSLSLYIIAAFHRDDPRSTEAGLKYFVLGAVASGMLLYGISLVYGFSGTTNFDTIARMFSEPSLEDPGNGIVFGIVFILAGLAFKISAVPFHMWAPDVYEGAPTPVTAFFAIAPKIAALALLMRVMLGPFGDLVDQWQQIVIFISVGSMFLGSFAAVNQRNIKRLMAYSSISHVGYALIGLSLGSEPGARAILIYLTIYLFMNIGTFSCILCMRRGGRMVERIDDLAGLGKTHPMVALALAIFMFSMAGIPPLAGFFGKLYIFQAAIAAQFYTIAIIGVLTSVVSAFYYLRIIRIIYFDEVQDPLDQSIDREISIMLALSGVLIVAFIAYPEPIVSNAADAAASLFDS